MPANNSIEILTSISKSVSMIVNYLAPQNTDKDSVSKESSSIPAALVVSLSVLPSSVKKVA